MSRAALAYLFINDRSNVLLRDISNLWNLSPVNVNKESVPANNDTLVAKGVMLHHLAYPPLHLLGVLQAGLGRHAEGAVRAAVVPHLHRRTLAQWFVVIQEVPLTVKPNIIHGLKVTLNFYTDEMSTIGCVLDVHLPQPLPPRVRSEPLGSKGPGLLHQPVDLC
ncbi:hypothetical protein E2C01_019337 [Portunus trituberculatus]|uniref:Uncharacterized protein n=1 Tax=Portunus trituberculatus TaxID=210409 RepID=A0A5B7E051_PORTR|nr:hypothetical protein [Portunus trituberculatus]